MGLPYCWMTSLLGRENRTEFLIRLNKVLARLEEAGLTLSENKCEIGKDSLVVIGFRIDGNGLHTTDDKVRAVLDAPKLDDEKTVQAF